MGVFVKDLGAAAACAAASARGEYCNVGEGEE